MNKQIINVPPGIRFMSDWPGINDMFPRHKHILNKQVPGCGFTEWALTCPGNLVLCSPRNMLILNKWEQHKDTVFRVCGTGVYDMDIEVDRDLQATGRNATIAPPEQEATEEEYISFTKDLSVQLVEYFKAMDEQERPYKILVTYDSFRILKDVLSHFQVLGSFQIIVDEFQTIFTDSRFKSTTELEFVGVLGDIEKVCFVSATPMMEEYLDMLEEFKDLPYYQLDWAALDMARIIKPTLKVRMVNSIYQPVTKIIESYKSGNYETYMDPVKGKILSKEAMIYVNSVRNIIGIIKRLKLAPEEVNILCANTDMNQKRIRTKLGAKFKIGRVPLANEPRKMFTLCTRTVYLGADFHSDNARTFIISDANLETLAVDISLDLPQILGRQRNTENPWKNTAEFYYKPFIKAGETKEVFEKRIQQKLEFSDRVLNIFKITDKTKDKDVLIAMVGDRVRSMNYKNDYVGINKHAGSQPVLQINNLVLSAERRAYDIQQVDYRDRFSVFSSINTVTGIYDDKISDEINSLMEAVNMAETIREKLKIIFEFPVSNESRRYVINNVGDFSLKPYLQFNPADLRACGYNITKIRQKFNMAHYDWNDINKAILSSFKPGDRLANSEIKKIIAGIYEKHGYPGKAKAIDISKWFEVNIIRFRENGKIKEGREIIKPKIKP